LNALFGVIDYVCITDTGSEDKTIKKIKKWGVRHNVPTVVEECEFRNFGYSRTKSFENVKKHYPDADYVLLVDADMVLVIEDGFDKQALAKGQYMFKQKSTIIEYWNTRLISTKYDWKCMGVTHEYWDPCDSECEREKLGTIWIDDKEDGGHKANKFTRDYELLTSGIENPDEPDHLKTRYKFYLAQTCRDMGKNIESIKWYRERISDGGWDEEVFYSYMQIGVNYERLERFGDAIEAYLNAFDKRNIRAESLYAIAKIRRLQSKNSSALMFALRAKDIPFPQHDSLFIDYKVYKYLLDEEISINAFYVEGFREAGREACERVLSLEGEIPETHITLAKSNYEFYK
jgi:tetratricopeptide (TPR) repeat protein